jgi:putative Mg2+ transporter-C (MgtC) family protein
MNDTVDRYIVEWFTSGFGGTESLKGWGYASLFAICFLATILFAGVLGFEREYHGHEAGLRTHLLVALGSAVVMMLSIWGFPTEYTNRDPARLAAQVVTGIGFLGAGTIVQTGADIRGLTTATTIWVSMAIGLACGSGNIVLGAAVTAAAMFVLIGLRGVEKFAARKNPIVMIVVPADSPVLRDIILIANRYNINIRNTSTELISYQGTSAIRLTMRCSYASRHAVTAFADEIRFTVRPLVLKVTSQG